MPLTDPQCTRVIEFRATGSNHNINPPAANVLALLGPEVNAHIRARAKRARQRKRKRKNVADYRARRRKGIVTLHIVAYDLRAETFARRYCGLTGKNLSMEQIAQAITDYVNKMGA
jgi:hypothetical protein